MIIQPFIVTQGDYGYTLNFTLEDGNGNVVNLTGLTLALNVQSASDPTKTLLSLGGSMAVDNATAGTCHYSVAQNDFTTPGTYLATIVTSTSGGSPTSVSYSGITIIVNPSLPKTIN